MKKGYTLIEVVVAMGIFAVFSTIAIGAFVLIINMKSLTGNIRDSNQKLRFATEYISRYGRQAEKIDLIDTSGPCSGATCPGAIMYFADSYREKFLIEGGTLKRYVCTYSGDTCDAAGGWNSTGIDMFSGSTNLMPSPNSYFQKVGGTVPRLLIVLDSEIDGVRPSPFFDDALRLEISVPLENLK